MSLETGQEAPEFDLKASTGENVKLSQFRGDKAVAVVFYPFTFTGVCHGELCALRDDFSRYEAAGVEVLAVSCDTVHAQKKWAESEGYKFALLADFWPHGEVSKAYGVFNDEKGCANRATFLIDKNGLLVDSFTSEAFGTPREQARYEEALAKL